MMQPAARLPLLLRYLLLLLLLWLTMTGACQRSEDCKLFNTCAGSLITMATELAGETKAAGCRQCLKDHCAEATLRCSADIECNFASRCMLKASPSEYQECIRDLYEGDFTRGHELRYPWEGERRDFGRCLHANCRSQCIDDPFDCNDQYQDYTGLRIEVAVRSYPEFEPLPGVSLKPCLGVLATLEERGRDCIGPKETDEHGTASFETFDDHVGIDRLYFEIAEQAGEGVKYPKTFYYPGRLGNEGRQLLAIYVVTSEYIAESNAKLHREEKVLDDAAQSLILTDSCVWEEISVPGLHVQAKAMSVPESQVPQCHTLGNSCGPNGCAPCIWYARLDPEPEAEQAGKPVMPRASPEPTAQETDGTGAGIVGLLPGFYTIHVDRAGKVVSKREMLRMEAGAMTIVRTWPLNYDEQREFADP